MQNLSPNQPRPPIHYDIRDDIPAYVVIEKRGFFDDTDRLWDKGSMIYWEGVPNMGLDPLNDLAEEKMREFLMDLDEKANEISKTNNRASMNLMNAFEARQRLLEMDRKSGRAVDQDEQMPILQAKKGESKAKAIQEMRFTPMLGAKREYKKKEKIDG